mmetsp:Transcript_60359/g.165366  ORF Transcript_60359/g.165366 Transcript_60359/m.165366 type:complete len:525 (+) Transcript_60359:618-2192(+)
MNLRVPFTITPLPRRLSQSWLGHPNNPIPGLERSFGHSTSRVRAKLVVNYDYHDYPRDEQLLRMEIELESSLSDDVVTIVPSASIDILPSDEHPVWKMVDVQTETLRAMPYPFASEGKLIPRTPAMDANPAYTFIRTEFERGAHSGNAISQGVVIFRVIRDLPYYIYNYVLIEAMLVALGFTCFTINRDATDVRLTIAMGLVLSINVFQVVLVENIPETGYLTRLTRYTVFNEGLLIIISMHAVLIGHCHKVHERLLEVRELLRIYSRQRGQQAVIRLQRAFRRFRAARRAGRALRSSAAHSRRSKMVLWQRASRVRTATPKESEPCGFTSIASVTSAVSPPASPPPPEHGASSSTRSSEVAVSVPATRAHSSPGPSIAVVAQILSDAPRLSAREANPKGLGTISWPPAPPGNGGSPSTTAHTMSRGGDGGVAPARKASFLGAVRQHSCLAGRRNNSFAVKVNVLAALMAEKDTAHAMRTASETWKRRIGEAIDSAKVWFDEWGDSLGFCACVLLLFLNVRFNG